MSADMSGLRYTAAVDKRFKSPGPQPNGIQAAGAGLWCIDQVDLKVYLLDWATGATLQEFQTATQHSSGITQDGDGNLWITSTWQLEVRIPPREPSTPWTRRRDASTTCSASPSRTRCTA
jgi:streptogramin lyase